MRKLLIVTLLLLAPSLASATIVRALSVSQMTQEADAIVHGTVVKKASGWNPEKTRIYTLTTIKVTADWKSPKTSGGFVTVRQIGGTVDGLTQSVVGNAELAMNEEVILFLERSHDGAVHFVMGMAQGKFEVTDEGDTKTVGRKPLDGIRLVAPGNAQPVQNLAGVKQLQGATASPLTTGQSFQIFRNRVRLILAR